MSLIHYKFRAAKDFDSVTFDGTVISVLDLKREIATAKKLRGQDFDLLLTNAQTNEEYGDERTLISKNTSILVKRVPLTKDQQRRSLFAQGMASAGAVVAPITASGGAKYNTSNAPHAAPTAPTTTSANTAAARPALSANATEDERIEALMKETGEAYNPQNYAAEDASRGNLFNARLNPMQHANPNAGGMSRVPPDSYVCFRCGQQGHYINFCPTNSDPSYNIPKVKRTTGIPKSFLKEVDKNEAGVSRAGIMLSNEGSLVMVRPNRNEWQRSNAMRQGTIMSDMTTLLASAVIPSNLSCPLCQSLLRDAVRTACCQTAYCDDCIRRALLAEEDEDEDEDDSMIRRPSNNDEENKQSQQQKQKRRPFTCPNCSHDATPDTLIPDTRLRTEADAFLKRLVRGQSNAANTSAPVESQPIPTVSQTNPELVPSPPKQASVASKSPSLPPVASVESYLPPVLEKPMQENRHARPPRGDRSYYDRDSNRQEESSRYQESDHRRYDDRRQTRDYDDRRRDYDSHRYDDRRRDYEPDNRDYHERTSRHSSRASSPSRYRKSRSPPQYRR